MRMAVIVAITRPRPRLWANWSATLSRLMAYRPAAATAHSACHGSREDVLDISDMLEY
jgi:hypothetical protein